MRETIVISITTLLLILASIRANAFEYEVDMPNSGNPQYEAIRVSVDGCDTIFKINKKEFPAFRARMHDDPSIVKDMVNKAITRSKNGCL